MPVAEARIRKVRSRTRTANVSSRPTLAVSSLSIQHVDLTPGVESVVCEDCTTWCPVVGTSRLRTLAPHHTEKAGTPNPRRCPGSNRRVDIDIDVPRWQELQDRQARRLRDTMPAENRRAARQHYKPIPAPAPAVVQMPARPTTAVPQAVDRSAEIARPRHTLHLHYPSCTACTAEQWCPVAEELARQVLAAEQLRNQEAAARYRDEAYEEKAVATRRRQRGREWASFDEHATFWPGGHPTLAH